MTGRLRWPIPIADAAGLMAVTGCKTVSISSHLYLGGSTYPATDSAQVQTTRQTRRLKVMTFYQGDEISVSATFKTLASGLNCRAFGQIDVPDKGLTLPLQNFDYINQYM